MINYLKLNKTYSLVIIILFKIILSTSNYGYSQSLSSADLSSVKVDLLTDDQIKSLINYGSANGMGPEQAEKFVISRGLPASEAEKLKIRIYNIQKPAAPSNTSPDISNYQKTIVDPGVVGLVAEETLETIAKTGTASSLPVYIYGQQLFRSASLKVFDRSIDAKASENYIIGVGDELAVSVFGVSFYNEVLKVDSRGAVNPNQMGPIFVKGLTFERAKGLIRTKFSQYFDLGSNKVDITIAYARSINVNIVGEVLNPGSYKMPAVNTAFNALMIAGGTNDIGSLRNIQVRRGGKIVKNLDVYEFLKNPNSKNDFYLEDNDYLVVSTAERVVGLKGEIRRPLLYELKAGENLKKVIEYAGGTNPNAYTEKIQLKRITPSGYQILDIKYDSLLNSKGDFNLIPGDEILIRKSSEEIRNIVIVSGAIKLPGTYEFKSGMKVSDLVKTGGGVLFETMLEKAYVVRTNADLSKQFLQVNLKEVLVNISSPDNLILQDKDELIITSYNELLSGSKIAIFDKVKNFGEYPYVEGMTLGDALILAGGFQISADNLRIEISRMTYFSDEYVPGAYSRIAIQNIEVPRDLKLNNEQLNFKLSPYDHIFVRTIPGFQFQQNVRLTGEVKYPGTYTILNKAERISDLIKRAGGLTKYAFNNGATFYRPELPGGFIVLDLESVMRNPKSKYNYVLKVDDRINIPTIIDFVGIRGSSVQYLNVVDVSQVNAPYVAGKRAKYYINEFGNGFSKDSWRKKTYVIENNAKVSRTKNFFFFKIYPKVRKGSVIYVVAKPPKEPKELTKPKDPFDINKFIENTMTKVTGIAAMFLLLRQL
jgi:polysaccharide export outer membrane protein